MLLDRYHLVEARNEIEEVVKIPLKARTDFKETTLL